ncbi:MAG: alpha/beta hydrolase [Bacteroides sp.]|nr:alpha/beta hydrolase [Bacteroides sp.]
MEKDIFIDGLKIHYEDVGKADSEGRTLLLMHGWGCSHKTVKSISAILESDMRIINVDLPGHGDSSEPPGVWGIEDFTMLMEKLVEELALKNVSLIGHSFGGRIALLMASRNQISKVVLVDAAGIKPKRSFRYYWKVYTFKLIKNLLLTVYGKDKGGRMVEKWRSRKGSSDYRNSSPIMRAVMSKCVNEDLKYVMPKISAPTLLVWGADDTATPLSDAKTMEKLIPDAGLVTFENCGHYSFLDNPIGFKAVIKAFFK